MKKFENQNERLVILTDEEYEIINKALNNRMVHLQEKQKEKNNGWPLDEWNKCLKLQIEWFD